MRKKILIYTAVVAVLFTSVAFVQDYFEVSRQLDIFSSAYREVNQYYVDDIKPGELLKRGLGGMLKNLDPYTVYYPESEIEDYRLKHVGSEYGGIGASSFRKGDSIVILEVHEGYAAQKAGLRIGDVLLEVNGRSIKDIDPDEVDDLIRGQSNTSVRLRVMRLGKPLDFTITREEIKTKNVSYTGMINDSVGYIKLDKFLMGCYDEMLAAVQDLKKNAGLKSVVFDLRGNGGGLVDQTVEILSLFMDKGTHVLTQKGKITSANIRYETKNEPLLGNVPMVVLVDRGSASASEITAGNFQDIDRAVIIGQRSFGKGLVQQTRPLSYGTQFKVTIAKYYTNSGRCVQALNYASRHEDGSVDKVPDSLMSEFKTVNGRTVYDGSGVYPDRFIEPVVYSNITLSLLNKLIIFDFATWYRSQHDSIPDPSIFSFTDADYNSFVKFLNGKEYSYNTSTENIYAQLKDIAKDEKYYERMKTEIEDLGNKLKHNKSDDLVNFKKEISSVIEKEIVSRYYYQSGRFRYSFRKDEVLADALKVLADPALYNSILKGEGKYKTIGHPGKD
ncbi:MAG: S41 family peptidase [Bacteroidota bacterium]